MDHIDSSNVKNFTKCKQGNAEIMPINQDFVSTACNQLPGITHVRKQVFLQCHKRHHTLLHIDRQIQSINDKRSVTNGPADAKGSSTAEVNTYCSFKGKPRNQILPATAIVEVQNNSGYYVPCRVLLDSASQSHFITERCVQLLRLSRNQTHAQIQGISSVNTKTYHSVSLHFKV